MMNQLPLNAATWARCDQLLGDPSLGWREELAAEQGRWVQCDGPADGLRSGLELARICLSGLADVQLTPCPETVWSGPAVSVSTDSPLLACIGSQYAGWQIQYEKFFAMGSGPMRSAYGQEEILREFQLVESSDHVVGVLETAQTPSRGVYEMIAERCRVPVGHVRLLTARTASLAGTIQVVARSVETCLHKLHEVGFDIRTVKSGWGIAPIPPVAKDDLHAIGRTNDAVLYGGEVTLWVETDDAVIEKLGPRVPSQSSTDFGRPFYDIFKSYEYDFYKIDPHLFSPALVRFHNLRSGKCFRFGTTHRDILLKSFLQA